MGVPFTSIYGDVYGLGFKNTILQQLRDSQRQHKDKFAWVRLRRACDDLGLQPIFPIKLMKRRTEKDKHMDTLWVPFEGYIGVIC